MLGVVHVVFLDLVRSKTTPWQMLGCGIRLSPDLCGPGDDKTHFLVRPHLKLVERVAGRPAEIRAEHEFSKRFDLQADDAGS